MFKEPGVEDIIEIAAAHGLALDKEQAEVYLRHTIHQLQALDSFLESPIEAEAPHRALPGRDPGHRPTAAEDPFRAWRWKCKIDGASTGLLEGKTISFKDNIAVAGIPMTLGSPLLEDFRPDFDATIVARVLAAGGQIIGKNTLSSITAQSYPPPINPHDAKHTTGGSSSGSAVVVAAREVDISFGGDQGGSVRIPAAFCGLVGLKPTFGLVSHVGATYLADPTIDHVGPMALHVDEVARALQAVAGYDELDPRGTRAVPEHLEVMQGLDFGVKGLRIGILAEGFVGAEPAVADAVREAIEVLAKAGALISEVSIAEHRFTHDAFLPIRTEGGRAIFDVGIGSFGAKTYYPASLIEALDRLGRDQFAELTPAAIVRHISGQLARESFHGLAYAKAQNVRAALIGVYDRVLEDVDVLVMPTALHLPDALSPAPSDPLEALEASLMTGRWLSAHNTTPFNYTGHPALSVPCAKVGTLPTSMQLVGRYYDDPLLLRTAQAYESLVDWEALTSTRLTPA